jgi:cytochrome c551/c552
MKKISLIGIKVIYLYAACDSSDENITSPKHKELVGDMAVSDEAKNLFMANCASCHNPLKDATGPALKGTLSRVPSRDWLVKWIQNPAALISEKDAYALAIYEKWNKTPMTAFPNLTNEEVDLLIDEYCQ